MKTTLKKLGRIAKFIDMTQFYSVTFDSFGDIRLQGKWTPKKVEILSKYFDFKLGKQYIEASRYNVTIILTD